MGKDGKKKKELGDKEIRRAFLERNKDFFKKNILYGVSEEVDEIMHEVIFLDRLKEMMDDNVTYKGIICFKVAERIKRYAASLDKSMG